MNAAHNYDPAINRVEGSCPYRLDLMPTSFVARPTVSPSFVTSKHQPGYRITAVMLILVASAYYCVVKPG